MARSDSITVGNLRQNKKLFPVCALVTASGKPIVKHEEMPEACKVFRGVIGAVGGTVWILSWFMPETKTKTKTEEEKRAEKMATEYDRVMRDLDERK